MTEARQQELYNETVVRLIKESGKPISLVKPTSANVGTGYVPGVGYTTPAVPTTDEGYGLEIEADTKSVSSAIIEQTLLTLMCIEIDNPQPKKDSLTMDSITYSIIHVEKTQPGNVLFYYTLYLGV